VPDRAAVARLVAGADVVVHLAFLILGRLEQTQQVNLEGSRNVFEAAVAAKAKRLVYASSVAAYGFHADNPPELTEDVQPRGTERQYYSAQKAALEGVLEEVLEGSKTEIRRALGEIRAMLFDLHRPIEDAPKASEPLTRYIEDVVKRWRLPARVAVEGDLSEVPARVLSVAYVVIREALANAAKHASNSNVTVQLSAGEHDLTVTVGDAGQGFTRRDEELARRENHIGLEMLRRRVGEIGGNLEIESRPGDGTRVVAKLPLAEAAS